MRCFSSCFRASDVSTDRDSASVANVALTAAGAKYLRGHSQTRFYCCGTPHQLGSYWKRHGMYGFIDAVESDSSKEASPEDERYLDVVKIDEPDIPYSDKLPTNLCLGRSIEVFGKPLNNCNRFTINLSSGVNDESDLALHFKPYFDRKIVVRNHRIYKKWGTEEIASPQPFPFRPRKNFSVLIFVADEQFMIAVNKIHFCAFAFRIPIDRIKCIIITGDIELHSIQYSIRTSYPPKTLSKKPCILLPRSINEEENKCDIRRKCKVLWSGTKVQIFGRLKLLPRGFYINLQEGLTLWPHPIIPFHMSVRLHYPGTHKNEYEVIFNTWMDGAWQKETVIKECPFMPGTVFEITIECSPLCFIVIVNDRFFHKFGKKAMIPFDSIVIQGDVVIEKVIIRSVSMQTTPQLRQAIEEPNTHRR